LQTPLHAAAEHGYVELATLLLAHGADKDATDVVRSLRVFSHAGEPGKQLSACAACCAPQLGKTPLDVAKDGPTRVALGGAPVEASVAAAS
jgi:ankyrin repeat protein